MKKTSLTLPLIPLLFTIPASGAVLFSDSFDRPDSNDIDASNVGMGGSLGPLAYVEATDDQFVVLNPGDANGPGFTNIGANQLALADGPNAAGMHIDHNFIGSTITTAGGFRVSLDITNAGTADQINERFAGFGVGMTAAETSTYYFDFNSSAVSPGIRGHQNTTTVDSGVADWNVSLIRTNAGGDQDVWVSIYQNGVETHRFTTDDNGGGMTTGSLSVDFALSSFASGATVTPLITLNGESVGGAADLSFQWDADDSNYIGLAARQNSEGWNFDNLSIETIPEPSFALLGGLGLLGLLRRRR